MSHKLVGVVGRVEFNITGCNIHDSAGFVLEQTFAMKQGC